MPNNLDHLTLRAFRRLTADLPDDTIITPHWVHGGPPSKHDPAVELCGFRMGLDEDNMPVILRWWTCRRLSNPQGPPLLGVNPDPG